MSGTHTSARERVAARDVLRAALAVCALTGLVLTLVRVIPAAQRLPVLPLLASFVPFGILPWAVAAILAAALRQRIVALLAIAALALHISWLAPYYLRTAPQDTAAAALKVASANILGGATDLDRLSANTADRDVVVLIELDPASEAYVDSIGWLDRYPYRIGRSDPDGAPGLKIYSRFPLTERANLDLQLGGRAVRVDLPSGDQPTILAVHAINPLLGISQWHTEGERIAEAAATYGDGPLVVLGDFNATPDHLTIRTIRSRAHLTSAADALGAGWLPTWPADSWLPPILPLDQALVSSALTPTAVHTIAAPGSDHLGIAVDLALTAQQG